MDLENKSLLATSKLDVQRDLYLAQNQYFFVERNESMRMSLPQQLDTEMVGVAKVGNVEDQAKKLQVLLKQFYQSREFTELISEKLDGDDCCTRLEDCFVNLALVDQSEPQNKESALLNDQIKTQTSSKTPLQNHTNTGQSQRQQYLNFFEAIHYPKIPIELNRIFPAGELSQDLPEQARHILIEGCAGIGKTTLSKYLAYQWARGEAGNLPQWESQFSAVIFIRLRNLLNREYYSDARPITVEEVILKEFEMEQSWTTEQVKVALMAIERQPVLYILDGFDEIAEQIKNLPRLAPLFKSLLKKSFYLITARPASSRLSQIESKVKRLEIIGFLETEIKLYIDRYVRKTISQNIDKNNAKKQIEQLTTYLLNNPNLRAIARIPLNLEWLCALPQADRQTQATLSDVYDKMVRAHMLRYARRINAANHEVLQNLELTEEQNNYIEKNYRPSILFLGEIAWKLMIMKRLTTTKDDFSIENKAAKVVAEIALRGWGIIQPFGQVQDWKTHRTYYFLHLTFQEFFAAINWVDRFCSSDKKEQQTAINELHQFCYHPSFEVVWRFVAGLLTKRDVSYLSRFWAEVVRLPKDHVGLNAILFLLTCFGEAYNSIEMTQKNKLLSSVKQWLFSPYRQIGLEQLIQILDQYPYLSESLQPIILALIRDKKNWQNRWFGCTLLGKLSNITLLDSYIETLTTATQDEESGQVRKMAVIALGQISSHAAVEKKDQCVEIILDKLTDAEILPIGLRTLEQMAFCTNQALEERRIKTLIEILRYEKNLYLRQIAANTLRQPGVFDDIEINSRRLKAFIQIAEEIIQTARSPILIEQDITVQFYQSIVKGLGELPQVEEEGLKSQRQLIIIQILSLPLKSLHQVAEQSLYQLQKQQMPNANHALTQQWIKLLISLSHQNILVCNFVIKGLFPHNANEPMPMTEALEMLFDVVKDKSPLIRQQAAEILGKVPISSIIPTEIERLRVLLKLLEDSHKDINGNFPVRKSGIHALSCLLQQENLSEDLVKGWINEFCQVLSDKRKATNLRKAAAQALGKLSVTDLVIEKKRLKALIEAMNPGTKSTAVNENAARSLGLISTLADKKLEECRIQALIATVQDQSTSNATKRQAIAALGCIQPSDDKKLMNQQIMTLLELIKNNRSYPIVQVTAQALTQIVISDEVELEINRLTTLLSCVTCFINDLIPFIQLIDQLIQKSYSANITVVEAWIRELVEILKDRNEDDLIKQLAAKILGQLPSTPAVELEKNRLNTLIGVLSKNKNDYFIQVAIQALGNLPTLSNPHLEQKRLDVLIRFAEKNIKQTDNLQFIIQALAQVDLPGAHLLENKYIKTLTTILKKIDNENEQLQIILIEWLVKLTISSDKNIILIFLKEIIRMLQLENIPLNFYRSMICVLGVLPFCDDEKIETQRMELLGKALEEHSGLIRENAANALEQLAQNMADLNLLKQWLDLSIQLVEKRTHSMTTRQIAIKLLGILPIDVENIENEYDRFELLLAALEDDYSDCRGNYPIRLASAQSIVLYIQQIKEPLLAKKVIKNFKNILKYPEEKSALVFQIANQSLFLLNRNTILYDNQQHLEELTPVETITSYCFEHSRTLSMAAIPVCFFLNNGCKLGIIRGTSRAIENFFKAKNYNQVLSRSLYYMIQYGSYFTWCFNNHYQKDQPLDAVVSQVAMETIQFAALDLTATGLSQLAEQANGESGSYWKRTSSALSMLSGLCHCGIFAYNAKPQSTGNMVQQIITGYVSQQVATYTFNRGAV